MGSSNKGSPVGPITKGMVIKDQGKVPYHGPKVVSTPQGADGTSKKGTISPPFDKWEDSKKYD